MIEINVFIDSLKVTWIRKMLKKINVGGWPC